MNRQPPRLTRTETPCPDTPLCRAGGVTFTVGESREGQVFPYPDAAFNREDAKDPAKGLISVQSVVADGKGRVWLLDTAAPGFAAPKVGGAKLVAVDLASNKVVTTLVFPANVMLDSTYLTDMRFDFRVGQDRSEERRVGKACVSAWSSRWCRYL